MDARLLKAFEKVSAGKLTKTQAARDLGMVQSTFLRQHRKWAQGSLPQQAPKPSKKLGGIPLSGLKTSPKKPQDSARTRLFELEEGLAYRVDDLCKEFSIRPETLIKHAKSLNCFMYAETSPENWEAVITKPKR